MYIKSQNLIPNNGLENVTQCPFGTSVLYFATPWFQPCIVFGNTTNSCSSDVYDTCAFCCVATGIPFNVFGHQFARTGHGYAGVFVHSDTINSREYIEVPLISQLTASKRYCVEFYVSLADSSTEAISNLGAYFSVDSLLDSTLSHTINYVIPQVENSITNMLNSKTNWMLVSGSFIATGGEKFMTIGNFNLPANTNAINVTGGSMNPSAAYYYIDDISVVDCTNGLGIMELTKDTEILISPNPSESLVTLTFSKPVKNAKMQLISLIGQAVMKEKNINGTAYIIDITDQTNGIYFIEITEDNTIIRKKLVVSHK